MWYLHNLAWEKNKMTGKCTEVIKIRLPATAQTA